MNKRHFDLVAQDIHGFPHKSSADLNSAVSGWSEIVLALLGDGVPAPLEEVHNDLLVVAVRVRVVQVVGRGRAGQGQQRGGGQGEPLHVG